MDSALNGIQNQVKTVFLNDPLMIYGRKVLVVMKRFVIQSFSVSDVRMRFFRRHIQAKKNPVSSI